MPRQSMVFRGRAIVALYRKLREAGLTRAVALRAVGDTHHLSAERCEQIIMHLPKEPAA